MADAIWNNRFILADPGKNETVLFENANGVQLQNGITLSESRLNFDRIRLTYALRIGGCPAVLEIPMLGLNRGARFIQTLPGSFDNHQYAEAGYCLIWQLFFVDCTETYLKSTSAQFIGKMNFIDGGTPGTWTQGANAQVPVVYSVVGVNRVSGGN